MPGLPSLIIGVGGTGLKVLQRVKERLIETYYGEAPPQITLLELDTALQLPSENFCGVQLTEKKTATGGSTIIPEVELIQTLPNFTMTHVFNEARNGERRWSWMEVDKLAQKLKEASRSILEGAGAYRPVGRTAFFLNYQQVENRLRAAMRQVMTEAVDLQAVQLAGVENVDMASAKRNVFVVGSLAGGTGSGTFLDVAVMLRNIKRHDQAFENIVLIGMVALPRFFAEIRDDIGRRVPNTYAGLRELDRFIRAHRDQTPYKMIAGYGEDITLNTSLFDLCYLVDIEDYRGQAPRGKTAAEYGALPAMVDMIVAHTDLRLGLRLNAANSNVQANYQNPNGVPQQDAHNTPQKNAHYTYRTERHFSALNSHTVVFPREDVIKALSLRFLLELIDAQLIPHDARSGQLTIASEPMRIEDMIAFLGKDNPTAEEKLKAELSAPEGDLDLGSFVHTLLQHTLTPERRYSTEIDQVLKWLIEDSTSRGTIRKTLTDSLKLITAEIQDRDNPKAYLNRVGSWQVRWLGPLVKDDDPFGDRAGGEWATAFGTLVADARQLMETRVQTLVLRLLNQRVNETLGEERTSIMRAQRVGYALEVLRQLKERTRIFIRQTEMSFGESSRNLIQLRKDLEDKRGEVAAFQPAWLRHNPGPDYQKALETVAEAERQKLLCNMVLQIAQQFGGDVAQAGLAQSVLDDAIAELEGWRKTLMRVREKIAEEVSRHSERRKQKYAIGARSYITDPACFPKVAQKVEDDLYTRHLPQIRRTLLGPDPNRGSGVGFWWEPNTGGNPYFNYAIMTKEKPFRLNPKRNESIIAPMLGEGSGAEQIAAVWREGAFRLWAERVRFDKQARVADYIPWLCNNQRVNFINQILEPNSGALVQLKDIQPDERRQEHYLAVDSTSDNREITDFYGGFAHEWAGDRRVFVQSESDVACTFLTLYHGLELAHFSGFADSYPAYRTTQRLEGALHLFPEERNAANYEDRIAAANKPEWAQVRLLHPDIAVCLNDTKRVSDFALAMVSGLIAFQRSVRTNEYYLALPDQTPIKLSNTETIEHNAIMHDLDLVAARLLQAFQTYMLRGHAIEDQFVEINYAAILPAFDTWFEVTHSPGSLKAADFDRLLKTWETSKEVASLYPLFNAESKDPRFRDLGIVLMLELMQWRKLYR